METYWYWIPEKSYAIVKKIVRRNKSSWRKDSVREESLNKRGE